MLIPEVCLAEHILRGMTTAGAPSLGRRRLW